MSECSSLATAIPESVVVVTGSLFVISVHLLGGWPQCRRGDKGWGGAGSHPEGGRALHPGTGVRPPGLAATREWATSPGEAAASCGYFFLRTVRRTGFAFECWTVPVRVNEAVTLYRPGLFRWGSLNLALP